MIIVFIQYRIGILGFLNTWSDDGYTETGGNYGLLDQQLAIKFIHENAQNIGGDPSKITILGESAGSESVGFQLLRTGSQNSIFAGYFCTGKTFKLQNSLCKKIKVLSLAKLVQ